MEYNTKENFYAKIAEYYTKQPAKKPFSKESLATVIKEIQCAKQKSGKKTRREYHLLSTYDILSVGNDNTGNGDTEIKYLVAYEDLYERCHEIHLPGEISENEKTLTENDLTGVISEPERQLLTTENNGQSGDGGSEDGEFSEVAAMESNMNENEELTIREEYIRKEREAAYEGQKRAAEKMLSPKHRKITFTVNDCVLVSVPKVDRGPTDPQNIVGIIIDCKNDVYQVATEYGVIKGWYGHDSLQHATSSFLKIEDLRTSKHLSLREAVAASSGGQGVAKCACKPSKQQCKTKRCLCKKSNRLCTSRCHSSLNCINK